MKKGMPDCQFVVSKAFLQACQRGDLRKVKILREQNEMDDWRIYRHDVSGDTGLHVAAREGHLDVVEYLCRGWQQQQQQQQQQPMWGADVTNKDMKRPLHEAAQFARCEVVQFLIQQGVQIDSLKRGDWTPLMLACTKNGNDARKCIQNLLASGADPCIRNSDGWNALFVACRTGDVDAVKLLLDSAPQCVCNVSNNGRSALHIAAFHGFGDIVDELMATRPDILDARDSSGSTALHESAKSGSAKTTSRLVELGADPQVRDNVGQTVLHVAAMCQNIETIEYILLNKLIDVHCETQFSETPFIIAKRHGKILAINVLTKFGGK